LNSYKPVFFLFFMLMLISASIPLAAEDEGAAPGHAEEIASYVLADGVIMARFNIPAGSSGSTAGFFR
jgi:hypothetical protein